MSEGLFQVFVSESMGEDGERFIIVGSPQLETRSGFNRIVKVQIQRTK